MEIEEDLDTAVARELSEETGLVGIDLEQMYTFGKCRRDPRGRSISVVFMGILGLPNLDNRGNLSTQLSSVRAGSDAASVRWFEIKQLPHDLAFDHADIIAYAVKKLKGTVN